MLKTLAVLGLVFLAVPATAQNVKNPTGAVWTCSADHATIDGYRLDILDKAGTLMTVIQMGKPVPDASNQCAGSLNVQPIKFDVDYSAVIRAYVGVVESTNSDPSNKFDRVPGRPGPPRLAWLRTLFLAPVHAARTFLR